MDLKLETFLVLCETMNYRIAAEKLHLSQSSVTKQIQALENEYGAKLFVYDGQRLHRTEKSYILENYAFSQRYNYQEVLEKMKEVPKKKLRMGMTKTIGDFFLMNQLIEFLKKDDFDFTLIVDNTVHLLELLDNNLMDFLVIEGLFDKEKYDFKLLKIENFVGICHKNHPFAGKNLSITDILNESVIIREDGSGSRKILENSLDAQGYSLDEFSRKISISSIHLIKKLLEENLGITFAYEGLIQDGDHLSTFDVSGLTSLHEFNIVFLKNTNGGELAKEFFKFP